MSTNKELREGVADKAKTCFLYVRVSTKMQVENGESIEAQLYDLRDYAKRNNLRILHEYIDDGYSGKNITGRPSLPRDDGRDKIRCSRELCSCVQAEPFRA